MDLKTLLPKEHILLQTTVRNRQELFQAATAPLVQAGIVTDGPAFVAALEAREEQVTTQVEGGIAFPHARSSVVRRLGLVLVTAPEPGLPFGPAAQPARLFFCIAVPAIAPTAHLQLLRALADFARTPSRVQRLLEVTMPSRVLRAMATVRI
jgi:mannitol/fructose-specific phosphotransferase system IIA component (Ntr-type)